MSSYISIEGLGSSDELYKEAEALLVEHQNLRSVIDSLVLATEALERSSLDEASASSLHVAISRFEDCPGRKLEQEEYKTATKVWSKHLALIDSLKAIQSRTNSLEQAPYDTGLASGLKSETAAYEKLPLRDLGAPIYTAAILLLERHDQITAILEQLKNANDALEGALDKPELAISVEGFLSDLGELGLDTHPHITTAHSLLEAHRALLPLANALQAAVDNLRGNIASIGYGEELQAALRAYENVPGPNTDLINQAHSLLSEHQASFDRILIGATQALLDDIFNELAVRALQDELTNYGYSPSPNTSLMEGAQNALSQHAELNSLVTQAITVNNTLLGSLGDPKEENLTGAENLLEQLTGHEHPNIEALRSTVERYKLFIAFLARVKPELDKASRSNCRHCSFCNRWHQSFARSEQ